MTESQPRVFLVDDDGSVIRALKRLVGGAGYEVETFTSAEAYLSREPYEDVACLVLDLQMPGMSGTRLQDRLIEQGHAIPIIFLTAHGDIPTSVKAMKHGATDFLTKPVEQETLLSAIDDALELCRQLIVDRDSHHEVEERVDSLTEREHEVMRYVIGGALNKQIAARLQISEKTVKAHRGQVMRKMAAKSVAQLVRLCEFAGIEQKELT